MRISQHFALVVSTCALIACASTSAVVPVGNGLYEITGSSATALSSGSAQKIRLIQAANDYCQKRSGKGATVVDANDTSGHAGSFANISGSAYGPNSGGSLYGSAMTPGQRATADVVFRCE
jgi:hypothetical protein